MEGQEKRDVSAELETVETNIKRLQLLSDAARDLLQTKNPVELLDRIFTGLSTSFKLDFYFYYASDLKNCRLKLMAYRGIDFSMAQKIEILNFGEGVCGTVARDLTPLVIANVHESYDLMTTPIREIGIKAYVCHPMITNGQILGTLSFGTHQHTTFSNDLVETIRTLTDMFATAISRKHADEALAARARLLDLSRDAIIVRDLEDKITYWNRGAEVLYGWTEEEVLGKVPYQVLQSVFPEPLERIRNKYKEDGFWEGEIVQTTKDGRQLTVLARWAADVDTKGELVGLIQSHTDITDRKKVRQFLDESISQFRLVVESAPNGMVMVDEHGVMTMVNAQMERLFGYTRDEMIGKPIEMLLPERYRSSHPDQRNSFFRDPEVRAMGHGRDLYGRRKDGSEFPVEVGLNPADTPKGKVVLAAVIDITQRKKAEEALAKSAAQLRLVVESAPNGMVMVNDKGEMLMVNAQMENLFGYERSEMIGHPIEMLLPQRYRNRHPQQRSDFVLSPITRAMGHGRDLYGRRKDGSEFPVEVGLNPAETPEGIMILAAVIDITTRKKMENELEKAHVELSSRAQDLERVVAERTAHLQETIAELEGVSYSLSHDMRAPLRTIQSFSQIVLMEAENKLSEKEQSFLNKTISAANRLDRLIQDVLIYSRVGRESIELKAINVETLLKQIIHERPDFQPPKAEVEIITPLEKALAHEAYLTQCITNLLDNAVKFVPAGRRPQIKIWSETFHDHVSLFFQDNGIGIPRDAQERVFGMFQRVHSERAYPGTGIGLSIVRKAVERMGGTISVESDLGVGSRFQLKLKRGDRQ